MIDLRSDTVTRPTAAMREAMARAEVGDDMFGEDPTVRALEELVARVLGKEAALFVTSGTMGNQLAIACHTRPGDDVIVGEWAHPVWYEAGAGAALSGVQFAVAGAGGLYDAEAMEAAIKPSVYWSPRTSLVCVENTHNRAGGRVFPQSSIVAIGERVRKHRLAFHLDGARLWNASVASGLPVVELAAPFDSVSVCFSKGLGAPVGSALAATREVVERARRFRKMWGGAMRQSGVLAAAALYALTHHRERLREDHDHARRLGEKLAVTRGFRVDSSSIETNLVNIQVEAPAARVVSIAAERGVGLQATGRHQLRAVTHLDVSGDDIDAAAEILRESVRLALAQAGGSESS